MIKSISTILKEISNMDKMKENNISSILAQNIGIDLRKKDKIFDNIYQTYLLSMQNDKPVFEIDDIDDIDIASVEGDYRIHKVELSNIRGFPKSEIPFGLNFAHSDKPSSAIILGSNGSGKSSIFDSLEYTFCRRIGETELRYGGDDLENNDKIFEDYLSHYDNDFKEAICNITTSKGKFTIHQEIFNERIRKLINPDAHFISDFDIYEKGRLNYLNDDKNSFHYLVAKNLGLKDILELNNNLIQFNKYNRLKEKREITKLSKELKTRQENIKSWEKSISENTKEINRLKTNQNQSVEKANPRPILPIEINLNSSDLQIEKIRTTIKDFTDALNTRQITIKTQNSNEFELLSLSRDMIDDYDDCPVCKNSKSTIEEIKIQINNRLTKIKENAQVESKLKDLTTDILYWINNSTRIITQIKTAIDEELTNLRASPFFSDIVQAETKLSTELNNIVDLLDIDIPINVSNESKHKSLQEFIKKRFNLTVKTLEDLKLNIDELKKIKNKAFLNYKMKGMRSNESDNRTQIREYENEIKSLKRNIEIANKGKSDIDNKIKKQEQLFSDFNIIKNQFKQIQREIEIIRDKEVGKAFIPIQNIVCGIVNDYLKRDGREVKLEIKFEDVFDSETGDKISEKLIAKIVSTSEKEAFSISPNKYFNTFHYRLFCSMIGISIAIASRKKSKINMPLILDDIFYASDFENRFTLEIFLDHLIKSFKEFTPELPLQLIMFTHDELIFDCISNLSIWTNEESIFTAKLFHHTQSKIENDIKELSYKFSNSYSDLILS